MEPAAPARTQYRFGLFEANVADGCLLKQGRAIRIQEQPFQILVALLERSGEVISREELRQRLWPGDTFVEFDKSLGVAVTKLRDALGDAAESPRFIETLPRRGYRFIAPVERNTGKPSSLGDIAAPAEGVTFSPVALEPPKKHWYYTWTWALLLGVLAIVVGVLYRTRPFARQNAATAEVVTSIARPQVRRSVAVLGFRNLPGRHEEDWLSQAFTEMLSTELAADGGLRLVPDEDVARAKRELPLGEEQTLGKSTLERLHTNPGADIVVLGSYTPIPGKGGDRIRLDVRLQDTANGETIAEDAVAGSKEDIFEIATRAGAHLRKSLGMSELSLDNATVVRASLPSTLAAARFYSEGKRKLWDFDFVEARNLLLKAVNEDPKYPLAHSALSDAWWHLGYLSKATAEAKLAMDLSGPLSQEERLRIEGSYWGTIANWPQAVEAYGLLFRFHPDSLEYGLRLAGAQYHVKSTDALNTLKTLRELPPPAGTDPRIDLLEASAQVDQDFVAAQAAAKRAIAKGTALGSPLMVARAYGILCQQGPAMGASAQEIAADCENARESYASAGDRNNEARTLNDFAGLYFHQGDLLKSVSMWREAQREFAQFGDTEGLAATANNIGDVFLTQGKLAEAKKMLEQAMRSYQATEDNAGVALVLNDLGDIAREQGDLGGAETTYQQARTIALETGDKSVLAYVLLGLGDVLKYRGELGTARKSYEESLALRNQTGEKQALAETQFALALLSIEDGRPVDAESVLRKCIVQFHQEQQDDDELSGRVALIHALLAQGKNADAKAEMERAELLAQKSQNFLARLHFGLASARVLLTSDHPESSRGQLEQILKDAHARGFASLEFEARLALAEMEKRTGRLSTAQAQLASLERVASAKGFGLIARKAAAARG